MKENQQKDKIKNAPKNISEKKITMMTTWLTKLTKFIHIK